MPTQDIVSMRARIWQWFMNHAEGTSALWLLALVAFSDGIVSPLAAEVYLAALMVAHPQRWKLYLPIAILASTLGALVGYYVAAFLFDQFGQSILNFYHLQKQFADTQHIIRGHVFWTVGIGSFLPLPDKAFIYAAGFLKVHMFPFIAGYFLGRGARMSVVAFLSERYGRQVVDVTMKYARLVVVGLLAILAVYGIVHLHIFGL